MLKLEDQLTHNKQMAGDLGNAKVMIETRDREINRLSML
jgi:hypothetical protein